MAGFLDVNVLGYSMEISLGDLMKDTCTDRYFDGGRLGLVDGNTLRLMLGGMLGLLLGDTLACLMSKCWFSSKRCPGADG